MVEDVERAKGGGSARRGGVKWSRGGRGGCEQLCATLPDGVEGRVPGASVERVVVETVELGCDERGGGVEDEGDAGGMMWGVAKENANTGAILPFVVGVLGLERGGKHIDGASKGMERGKIRFNVGAGESGKWGTEVSGASQLATSPDSGGERGRETVAKI